MTDDTAALGPPPRPDPRNAGRDLGRTLVRLRGWAGLNQTDVTARNAKLKPQSISDYENGKRVPRWETLDALVTVYLTERGLNRVTVAAELQRYWLRPWEQLQPPQQTRAAPRRQAAPPSPAEVSAVSGPAAVEQAEPVVEPPAGLAVEPARAFTATGTETTSARGRRWRLGWVLGGVGAAVVVAAVVAVVATGGLGTAGGVDAAELAPPNGESGAAPETSPSVPVVPGGRFAETVNTPAGARTYTDPYNLIGEGPRITNGATVQVACVITAPSVPSVGLYWYLIVDDPWGGRFYSPANAFLNGDPPEGGTTVVDPAVPACPR